MPTGMLLCLPKMTTSEVDTLMKRFIRYGPYSVSMTDKSFFSCTILSRVRYVDRRVTTQNSRSHSASPVKIESSHGTIVPRKKEELGGTIVPLG